MSISSEFTATSDRDDNGSPNGRDSVQRAAQQGLDIMKDNPVLTLVAIGVVGFAIGTLAGRSSVRRRSTLDSNLDSLQRAIESARSGAADTVGGWAKTLKNEGLLPDHIPDRVKHQVRRLLASVSH